MRKSFAVLACAAVLSIACGTSDAGITAAVKTKLAADTRVSAFGVDVDTRYHVVTLTGRVESAADHDHAIQLARETRGVRDVVDRLRISPTAATSGDEDTPVPTASSGRPGELLDDADEAFADSAITSKVKAALLGDDRIAALKIEVDTSDGVVMLNGGVRTRGDASRAVALAQQVKGVRNVVDNLEVAR